MPLRSQPLIDPHEMGKCLRAARILAGYERVSDLVKELDAIGVPLSARSLYAIERGQQLPHMDQFIGLAMVLKPPGGLAFFLQAIRPDMQPRLAALGGPPA